MENLVVTFMKNIIIINLEKKCLRVYMKSFNFVGIKFYSLTLLNMFMDTLILGFQIILNITKENKYFLAILNFLIVLATKYTKLNV